MTRAGRPQAFGRFGGRGINPADTIQKVNVGTHEDWITYSDHTPMTVDLRL